MKNKLTIIILLCSICLTICACNMNVLDGVNSSDSTEINTNALPKETVKPNEGERPILTFESENEYKKFLNLAELPADFVSYDEIVAIGAFKGVVFLSDAYANDYSSYMYSLVDFEGFEITLYVDHSEEALSTANSVSKVNKANMRLLSDTSSGVYVSGNIKYQYVSGELLSISWENQNINYTLCASGAPMLSDYPPAESTFVGKLFDTDTALKTLNTVFDEVLK